uniref:BTB domain-containing protein n=1 Tax=Oryza meridionalis TaxID=40149 RepID=A0A0E0EJC0_9ORYZ
MDYFTGSGTIVVSDDSLYAAFGYGDPFGFAPRARPPIRSLPFAAGGYQWCLWFHPTTFAGFFGFGVELLTAGAKARASFEFGPVDAASHNVIVQMPPFLFDHPHHPIVIMVWPKAMLVEEATLFVRDHAVVFRVDVTVVPDEPPPDAPAGDGDGDDVLLPPSDMLAQLGNVYDTKEGADVTFSVDGELFAAHRVILAMRSPVFRAAVYGEMKESGRGGGPIAIDDMRPDVFDALLRYIYTDALPASTTDDDDDMEATWSDLLVAADRYGVERLKLICERALRGRLDAGNVADMLALADRQHCETLKDACIEFMATSGKMEEVKASQGYVQLRTSCPLLLVERNERQRPASTPNDNDDGKGYISIYLELVTKVAKARVSYKLRLLNHVTGRSCLWYTCLLKIYDSTDDSESFTWETKKFANKSKLEVASKYLRDHRLVIECDVTVIRTPLVRIEAVAEII